MLQVVFSTFMEDFIKNPFMKPTGLFFFTLFTSFKAANSQSFGAGNVVVVRVGEGQDQLANTGAPVFLDEYTPAGTFVSQTVIPSTAIGLNKALILGGTGSSEGMITRSIDGKYLSLIGYNRNLPINIGDPALSGTTSASVNRSVARIDASKNIDLTTALTDFASGGSPRSIVTTNGADFWGTGGAGGVRYFTFGATTSTQISTTITNSRGIAIADNNLFVSSQTGAFRLGKMGSGLPTGTGQTLVNLPGFPTATGSPYQFVFMDLNGAVAGPDVLYIADDATGLMKYSLVGGNWVANGVVGVDADDYRGLTGYKNASDNSITLFAVRKGGSGSSGGGELVSLIDNTGYNVSIGTPTITVLATAQLNQAFRGVAMAPESVVVPLDLMSFSASSTFKANLLTWTTSQEFGIQKYAVQKSTDGQHFETLAWVNAKGNALYNEYKVMDEILSKRTTYYRLQIIEKDASTRYSKIVRLQSLGNQTGFAVWPNPVTNRNGNIIVKHPAASGKASIAIYAADGRMMLQYPIPQQTIQTGLALGNIPAGNYRVVYNSNQQRLTQQISVQ